MSSTKVGVFVDVTHLVSNGGFGMRFEVLRRFACRGGAEPMRLNAYVSFDPERAENDQEYRYGQFRFHNALRDIGFKVIRKDVKWYSDEKGTRYGKANVDLDLAVDALTQSESLDRVILATGDGDFVRVVHALQARGCRVEVLGFDNVAGSLRNEADQFVSGYLIPNLLPVERANGKSWGEMDSYVRGICYAYDGLKGFGWLRYLKKVDGELWRTDSRDPMSPYDTIFCHGSEFPAWVDTNSLPNRNLVVEFQIAAGMEDGKLRAIDLEVVRART